MTQKKHNRFNDTDFIVFNKEYTEEELLKNKIFGDNTVKEQIEENEFYDLLMEGEE